MILTHHEHEIIAAEFQGVSRPQEHAVEQVARNFGFVPVTDFDMQRIMKAAWEQAGR